LNPTKLDKGKPRFDLLPSAALTEVVRVLTFGAEKYAPYNYLGLEWSRLFAALMRHLWAWWRGEENDPETGISHLAHAGAGVLMLLHCRMRDSGKDDREPQEKADGKDS
jgi:hypothetical protein